MMWKFFLKTYVFHVFLLVQMGSVCADIINGERSFVIVITSYNSAPWYQQSLDSIFSQHYTNYKVFYSDICSTDGTADLVKDYAHKYGVTDKVTLIKNEKRLGSGSESCYNIIHGYTQSDDIVLLLNGGDCLAHNEVLSFLNKKYEKPHIWMTYGQFCTSDDPITGLMKKIPSQILNSRGIRDYSWEGSHFCTFYAELFKHIDKTSLQKDGAFFTEAGDVALNFCLLELAGLHAKFVPDVLYICNSAPSGGKSNLSSKEYTDTSVYIRTMKRYRQLLQLFDMRNEVPKKAVTYDFSGGRFGDNLIAYMHAKWFAYKHAMPLLYRPFPYADKLVLSTTETSYKGFMTKVYQEVKVLDDHCCERERKGKIVFRVPYFPESLVERKSGEWKTDFEVDWSDKTFIELLKRLICPKEPVKHMVLPHNIITVALHMRRGGSYEAFQDNFPAKFPRDSFYIKALEELYDTVGEKPLYIYIFTDDQNPALIAEKFSKYFVHKDMIFDYRREENDHNLNVLDDFFALTQFDCLIRPDSNFSLCASKLKDYLVHIAPYDCEHFGDRYEIASFLVTLGDTLAKKDDEDSSYIKRCKSHEDDEMLREGVSCVK